MRTYGLRIRLLVIAAVVVSSVWTIYPPAEKIRLGLDLKGGVHLVLRVETDDALQAQTRVAAEGLRDELTRRRVRYRLSGLNALVSIVLNLLVMVALMTLLGGAFTLPGIAGLILTIGMGVDSNVLIFERIKEELATARSPRAAVNAGFDRVWVTIVDTHAASLLAAAFLFQFGTAPIRGFATTLTLGLLANVFTAVFVSKTLFGLILARRNREARSLSI